MDDSRSSKDTTTKEITTSSSRKDDKRSWRTFLMDYDEKEASIDDFFSDMAESSSSGDDYEEESMLHKGRSQIMTAKAKKKKKKVKKSGATGSSLPNTDISAKEFKRFGKELIDFIADYNEGTRDRPVNHQAIQGYLFKKMPKQAPKQAVTMGSIYSDIKEFILPGLPQWQSPKHHALLPAGGSYASLLGSMICDGLGCVNFNWNECPAATELEMLVMNWMAQLMDLPIDFHFFGKGPTEGGGGIIQSSTTEALLTIAVTAKRTMLTTLKEYLPDITEGELQDRFVLYCSEQAHPSIERVAKTTGVKVKRLWTDRQGRMRSDSLRFAMEKDKNCGKFPFMVVATAGTIGSASMDQIGAIGPLLDNETPKVWLHIDAGYAGSSYICREYQPLMHGVDYADSFSISAHKWMPIHMDCACLWVKKIALLRQTFACEDPEAPLYIPHDYSNILADYREWSLPMTRRFRAMKIWMVFMLYGVTGLQEKIRQDVKAAKELERIISEDHRFEIMGDVMFGIVAFRCKRPDSNEINYEILKQLNKSAVIKMTGARVNRKFWLRFVVSGKQTDNDDVRFSWDMIKRTTNKVIADHTERQHNEDRCGMPNYKYVVLIGREDVLNDDGAETAWDMESNAGSKLGETDS